MEATKESQEILVGLKHSTHTNKPSTTIDSIVFS